MYSNSLVDFARGWALALVFALAAAWIAVAGPSRQRCQFLRSIPPRLLNGLPREDQDAIAPIVGKWYPKAALKERSLNHCANNQQRDSDQYIGSVRHRPTGILTVVSECS